jgi:hypothetical protein
MENDAPIWKKLYEENSPERIQSILRISLTFFSCRVEDIGKYRTMEWSEPNNVKETEIMLLTRDSGETFSRVIGFVLSNTVLSVHEICSFISELILSSLTFVWRSLSSYYWKKIVALCIRYWFSAIVISMTWARSYLLFKVVYVENLLAFHNALSWLNSSNRIRYLPLYFSFLYTCQLGEDLCSKYLWRQSKSIRKLYFFLKSLCHKINILLKTHYSLWCHKGDICISNKVEYLKKEDSYKNSSKEVT